MYLDTSDDFPTPDYSGCTLVAEDDDFKVEYVGHLHGVLWCQLNEIIGFKMEENDAGLVRCASNYRFRKVCC